MDDSKNESYLSKLESFNNSLCKESDEIMALTDQSKKWFPTLLSIFDKISPSIKLNPKENQELTEVEAKLSEILGKTMTLLINDDYVTSQIREIRTLFYKFIDVSKCYKALCTKLPEIPFNPTAETLQKAIKNKYSKMLSQLSDDTNLEPADLMSLNIFPSSFPHHVIAYSQALCNIIDIQRHLVFSKATLQSQIELFEIQNSSPSPKIIQQFPEFQKHVRLQNELLKHTAYLSNHIHNDFQNISKLCEQISSDRSTLIQLIQVDFTNNREGMLQYLDALVSFDLFIRHNKFVKILSTHFDPFKFTPRDYSKRLSDLSLQLQNSNLTEKQAVLTETIQIRDSIKSDIAICQEKLNELNQRLIASPIQNANMNTSRSQQNAINHFRDMINAFRQITDVSIECINSIQTIETASSIFSKQFGALNYKDLTLLSTVYHSSLNYFELLSESMKKKIEEKEQINSEILEQIYQCRAETDRIKMVAKSLRKKRKTPEIICNECEKCRKFVISRCGHSFCNSCIDKIYDERLFVCPACGTEFSEGDIIRINWK